MTSLHRTMIYFMTAGRMVVSGLSCKKESTTESKVQGAYELWKSRNIHNYTIDQLRSCFCSHAGELMRVVVRADTVFSVTRISDSAAIGYPYFLPIDSLFSIIRYPKADSLVVRYNAEFGYPEYLDVDPQLHPVDGGVLYETKNLQVE